MLEEIGQAKSNVPALLPITQSSEGTCKTRWEALVHYARDPFHPDAHSATYILRSSVLATLPGI